MFSVEQNDEGLKLRIDRRSIHPPHSGDEGVSEVIAFDCRLSDDNLAELQQRCGKEVVHWTTEGPNDLLDLWLKDEQDCWLGPFPCRSFEERSDDYTLTEFKLRIAALERLTAWYYDHYSEVCQEVNAVERTLFRVESELRSDLGRARTKREFLQETKREGVERLVGMEEAFSIALNRIAARRLA